MPGHAALEFVDGLHRAEQVELIESGTDGALDAPERVAAQELVDPGVAEHRLGGRVGEALPHRGGLRGHVVGAGHHQRRGVGLGQVGQSGDHGDQVVADDLQTIADQQLLSVLGDIARGHAEMDLLVARERTELVDASLHVVAGDRFARRYRLEVDDLHDGLVGLDHRLVHIQSELALSLQHRQPQPALQHHPALGRPQRPHLLAGIAGRQHVGDPRVHETAPRPLPASPGTGSGPVRPPRAGSEPRSPPRERRCSRPPRRAARKRG